MGRLQTLSRVLIGCESFGNTGHNIRRILYSGARTTPRATPNKPTANMAQIPAQADEMHDEKGKEVVSKEGAAAGGTPNKRGCSTGSPRDRKKQKVADDDESEDDDDDNAEAQAEDDYELDIVDIVDSLGKHLKYNEQHLADNAAAKGFNKQCNNLVRSLSEKKQIVLHGPPGVGKTQFMIRIAETVAENKPERMKLVQFHESYSYDHFVEGLFPRISENVLANGQGAFVLRDGPFKEMVEKARNDSDNDYVLAIDELNRANLSNVLGELFVALERKPNYSPQLLYSRDTIDLSKVPNLYIIACMNDADKSLGDSAALRRRFHFFECPAVFSNCNSQRSFNATFSALAKSMLVRTWPPERKDVAHKLEITLAELNDELLDSLIHRARDLAIAPSYFIALGIIPNLKKDHIFNVWHREVYPYLLSIFHGERDKPNELTQSFISKLKNTKIGTLDKNRLDEQKDIKDANVKGSEDLDSFYEQPDVKAFIGAKYLKEDGLQIYSGSVIRITLHELGDIDELCQEAHPVGFHSRIVLRDSTWDQRIAKGKSGLQYELKLSDFNDVDYIGTRFVAPSASQAWFKAYQFLQKPGGVSGPLMFGLGTHGGLKVKALLLDKYKNDPRKQEFIESEYQIAQEEPTRGRRGKLAKVMKHDAFKETLKELLMNTAEPTSTKTNYLEIGRDVLRKMDYEENEIEDILHSSAGHRIKIYMEKYKAHFNLDERLTRRGLKRKPMPADGHCQFQALAHQLAQQLGLPQPNYRNLREKAAEQIENDRGFYEEYMVSGDFNARVQEIRDDRWGDEDTLRALADALNVQIEVVSDQSTDSKIYSPRSGEHPQRTLIVVFVNGNHYDSTESIGNSDTAKFEVMADDDEEKVEKLAKNKLEEWCVTTYSDNPRLEYIPQERQNIQLEEFRATVRAELRKKSRAKFRRK